MFRFLGAAVDFAWPVWLIGWSLLLGGLYWTAPPWDQVAQDREFAFLPADAPTREGETILREAFPDDKQASNIVIIISRADHQLTAADRAFVKDQIEPALFRLAHQEGGPADEVARAARREHRDVPTPVIASIRTPDDPGVGALLVSADGHAELIEIELTTELLQERNGPLLDKIHELLDQWRSSQQMPAGLRLNLFGSAVVGRDIMLGQMKSARSVEKWTIIIVIVILALVYRAPFLAMIPLASVFMATQVATYVLAHLAAAGYVTLFEGIEVYVTIILYGTGVDYCLFLIARYQEMRENCDNCDRAMSDTICRIGPALVASSATVTFGIGMMAFARFGKFHDAGIALAISLVISLCVVLTFATSLLRCTGRLAFWPHSLQPSKPQAGGRWLSWDAVGNALMARPGLIWTAAVLPLVPFAVGGMIYSNDVDYNFLSTMPADSPSVIGAKALEDHFPAGTAGTVTAVLYEPERDFLQTDGRGQILIAAITHDLARRQTDLEIADLRSWDRPLGLGWVARQAIGAPIAQLERGKQEAVRHYISHLGKFKGHVTRFELTMLKDPMSRAGIAWLDQIEHAFRLELADEPHGGRLYFLGNTANMRDLRNVTTNDRLRIQVLAVICVGLILMILLRGVVIPIYLILSVLFSYFAALGATMLVFWLLDPNHFNGLDWKTPIFLFTILVAIGADYNIFLMTRVHEEQAAHGRIEGIHVALVRTGRIITSCGIIMAGTFGTLLAGSTRDLRELGCALAIGVMIDTFIVRPVMAPAFLIVLERGRQWWGRLSPLLQSAPGQPASK